MIKAADMMIARRADTKARADFAKAVQLSPELAAKVPVAFAHPVSDTAVMWPADQLSAGKITAPDLTKVKPLWQVKLDKPLEGLAVGRLPAGDDSHGIEIALNALRRADTPPRIVEPHAPVDADQVTARGCHGFQQ